MTHFPKETQQGAGCLPQIEVEEGRKSIITSVAHCREIIINVHMITVKQFLLPSCDCLLTRPRLDKTKRSSSVFLCECVDLQDCGGLSV